MRQKWELQSGGDKKTKHVKISKSEHFIRG